VAKPQIVHPANFPHQTLQPPVGELRVQEFLAYPLLERLDLCPGAAFGPPTLAFKADNKLLELAVAQLCRGIHAEFGLQDIPVERIVQVQILFRNMHLGQQYLPVSLK